MSDTKGPPSVLLPPVRVEPKLGNALKDQAEKEGRTLTDVIRCAIRDGMRMQNRQGRE